MKDETNVVLVILKCKMLHLLFNTLKSSNSYLLLAYFKFFIVIFVIFPLLCISFSLLSIKPNEAPDSCRQTNQNNNCNVNTETCVLLKWHVLYRVMISRNIVSSKWSWDKNRLKI